MPCVEWLNYHHLLYFWVVAKEGSIVRASEELHLAHPTISGQIHRLEDVLGEKLFARKGRNLVLTETGRVAFRYADEIFSLGREFVDTVKGRVERPAAAARRRGLGRAREVDRAPHAGAGVSPRGQGPRHLPREPVSGGVPRRAGRARDRRHPVGHARRPGHAGADVQPPARRMRDLVVRVARLAKACRRGFPRSLDGVPVLLPSSDSTFRRALNEWFESRNIRPEVIAELDDAALASVLGEAGLGVFAAPDVIEDEIRRAIACSWSAGSRRSASGSMRSRSSARSGTRRVVAICEVARKHIFA